MSTTETSYRMKPQSFISQNEEIEFHLLIAFDGSKHSQAGISLIKDLNIKNCQITTLSVIPTQQLSG